MRVKDFVDRFGRITPEEHIDDYIVIDMIWNPLQQGETTDNKEVRPLSEWDAAFPDRQNGAGR